MGNLKNLISLKEASIITGYHPDYLSQLIRGSKLKGSKIGRNWFTTRDAVTEYLAGQKFVDIPRVVKTRRFIFGGVVYACLIMVALGFIGVYLYTNSSTGRQYVVKDAPLDGDQEKPLDFSHSPKP